MSNSLLRYRLSSTICFQVTLLGTSLMGTTVGILILQLAKKLTPQNCLYTVPKHWRSCPCAGSGGLGRRPVGHPWPARGRLKPPEGHVTILYKLSPYCEVSWGQQDPGGGPEGQQPVVLVKWTRSTTAPKCFFGQRWNPKFPHPKFSLKKPSYSLSLFAIRPKTEAFLGNVRNFQPLKITTENLIAILKDRNWLPRQSAHIILHRISTNKSPFSHTPQS